MAYFFQLKYKEGLPDDMVLLTRGTPGQVGYMQIVLKKKGEGRNLKMTVTGEDGKEVTWESPREFLEDTQYYFIMGISNSSQLGQSLRSLYIDNEGGNDFSVLSENFQYDFSP